MNPDLDALATRLRSGLPLSSEPGGRLEPDVVDRKGRLRLRLSCGDLSMPDETVPGETTFLSPSGVTRGH